MFKSKAQRGYLYEHDPEVAQEFEEHTPEGAKLPEHIDDKKVRKKRTIGDYLDGK